MRPEHTLQGHVRTASARRFLRASTVQISVTYQYSYEISNSFVRRIKVNVLRTYVVCMAYVWRMECTRDVSTTYVQRSFLICGVSVLYQLLFNTFEKTNGCVHFVQAIRTLQSSKMPPAKST